MKTLGLIGGMSWESTLLYYRLINEGVRDALGSLRSAPVLLYSYDFEQIRDMQYAGRWDAAGESLAQTARLLEAGGADGLIICTNTMHKVADAVSSATNIPLIHIADCTGTRIAEQNISCVGLLGTRFTMEEAFYVSRIRAAGIDVLIPDASEVGEVNSIIYDELCQGVIREDSRRRYQDVIARLAARGAQGVILGCTEIGMLVGPADADIPLFDTTAIHAQAGVRFVLGCG